MKTATFRTCSPIEVILLAAFKGNQKVTKASFEEKFRNKSLRECIYYLKELEELSEEKLITMIEETHNYHLQNYESLQYSINSYIQKTL